MNNLLRKPVVLMDYTDENKKIALVHELLIDEHDYIWLKRANGTFANIQDIVLQALGGAIVFRGFVDTHADLTDELLNGGIVGDMYIVKTDEEYKDNIDNKNIEYMVSEKRPSHERYWECLGNPFQRGIDYDRPHQNSTAFTTSGAIWSYLNVKNSEGKGYITDAKWNDTDDTITFYYGLNQDGTVNTSQSVTIGGTAHRKVESSKNNDTQLFLLGRSIDDSGSGADNKGNYTSYYDSSIFAMDKEGDLAFTRGFIRSLSISDEAPSTNRTKFENTSLNYTNRIILTSSKANFNKVPVKIDMVDKTLDALNITGKVNINGDLKFTGALEVTETIKSGKKLTVVSGGADITGDSKITGAVEITKKLTVDSEGLDILKGSVNIYNRNASNTNGNGTGAVNIYANTIINGAKKLQLGCTITSSDTDLYGYTQDVDENITSTNVSKPIKDVYKYLTWLKKDFLEGIKELNTTFENQMGYAHWGEGGSSNQKVTVTLHDVAERIKNVRPEFRANPSNGNTHIGNINGAVGLSSILHQYANPDNGFNQSIATEGAKKAVTGYFSLTKDTSDPNSVLNVLQFNYQRYLEGSETLSSAYTTLNLLKIKFDATTGKIAIKDMDGNGSYRNDTDAYQILHIGQTAVNGTITSGKERYGYYTSYTSSNGYVVTPTTTKKILMEDGQIRRVSGGNWVVDSLGGDAAASDVLYGKKFSSDNAGRAQAGKLPILPDWIYASRLKWQNHALNDITIDSNGGISTQVHSGTSSSTAIIWMDTGKAGYIRNDYAIGRPASDFGNASKDAVLKGNYFTSSGSGGIKQEGTMTNNGNVSKTLNCGESYTIPKGYHGGSGKVTANSLASQTSATASASDIKSGKTAYVNGSKITGTMESLSILSQQLDPVRNVTSKDSRNKINLYENRYLKYNAVVYGTAHASTNDFLNGDSVKSIYGSNNISILKKDYIWHNNTQGAAIHVVIPVIEFRIIGKGTAVIQSYAKYTYSDMKSGILITGYTSIDANNYNSGKLADYCINIKAYGKDSNNASSMSIDTDTTTEWFGRPFSILVPFNQFDSILTSDGTYLQIEVYCSKLNNLTAGIVIVDILGICCV